MGITVGGMEVVRSKEKKEAPRQQSDLGASCEPWYQGSAKVVL